MLLVNFFTLSCSHDFSLAPIVAGNWSTSSWNQFHVSYFVKIPGYGHFQSLFNDKFVDVYVTSTKTARVEYLGYNFTVEIENCDTEHPYSLSQISDDTFIEIFFMSKSSIAISIINQTDNSIVEWSFSRPISSVSKKDIFKSLGYFSCLFIGLKIMISYCTSKQEHPNQKHTKKD